ncbi:hypothetical protein RZS08_31550, partial [Arthrospira platensis SPKY1]|nr:hypothetical protein [Arthrospira platensis SPKY1]
MPIAELSSLDRVLVVGSNLRKDHPLFAQRIRQAARKGAQVNALWSSVQDWALPVVNAVQADAGYWAVALAGIASAIAESQGVQAPAHVEITAEARAIALSMLSGERKAVLLGN